MALRFLCGNAGCGKSGCLYDMLLREAAADRRKRFFLIVPQQASLQTQKELVRRSKDHVIVNIDVVSFERLAFRVFDELGRKEHVLEETGKTLLLRKLVYEHEGELTVLKQNIKRPGSIDALKSMLSEFMQYGIKPSDLRHLKERLQPQTGLYDKITDLALLYDAFLQYLDQDTITGELLTERLIDLAPSSELLKGAVLALDGFTGLTPVQNKLMDTLLDLASDVCITVTLDRRLDPYGENRQEDLFYLSRRMVQTVTALAEEKGIAHTSVMLHDGERTRFAANPQLGHLEQNLFRPAAKPYACTPDKDIKGEGSALRVFSCGTAADELEQAAALIARMVREPGSGLHYRDFAIISADSTEHEKYAQMVFEKYAIPYFVDSRRDLSYHPLTECLRAAIQIVQDDFQPDSLLRFLRTGLTQMSAPQIDALEIFITARGIRGSSRWRRPFTLPASKRKSAHSEEQIALMEEELAQRNEQRCMLLDLLTPLYGLKNGTHTVLTYIQTLYDLLLRLHAEEKLRADADACEAAGRTDEASLYRRIYPTVMDLFDKFVELLGRDAMSFAEFGELLEAGLSGIRIGVIPQGGDIVILGDLKRTRLADVKYLFFLGVNDGLVPKKPDERSILSAYDRQKLADCDLELAPSQRDAIFLQRFYLYWILTKPSQGICLFYANMGPDGKPLAPSALIAYLHKLFPDLMEERQQPAAVLTPAGGMDAYIRGLQDSAGTASEAEDLPREFAALHQWYESHAPWCTQIRRYVDAAFYHAPQQHLSPQTAKKLYGRTMTNSVTRLEQFAQCPYAQFLSYGLRLSQRAEYAFEAVDLGTLYHDVLMRFSQETDAHGDWDRITPVQTASLLEACMQEARETYADSPLFDTCSGKHRFAMMQRVLQTSADVIIEQVRRGDYRPAMFEAEFSQVQRLPGGGRMRLTGKIDRLDLYRMPDGGTAAMRIVDYKSGDSRFSLPEFYYGLQMQLVGYVNAGMKLLMEDPSIHTVRPGGFFYLHLDDPLVDYDPSAKESQTDRIRRQMRLNGILSDDADLYQPMDRTMEASSLVIPLSLNKNGSISARGSSTADEQTIKDLCAYAERRSRETAAQILQGDIDMKPYRYGSKKGCDYCPYHSVCGFDISLPGYGFRTLPADTDAGILARISDEQNALRRQAASQDGMQMREEGR